MEKLTTLQTEMLIIMRAMEEIVNLPEELTTVEIMISELPHIDEDDYDYLLGCGYIEQDDENSENYILTVKGKQYIKLYKEYLKNDNKNDRSFININISEVSFAFNIINVEGFDILGYLEKIGKVVKKAVKK